MRNSQYARSCSVKAVKRGSGHIGGKKDRWNELGASLVEYALILSLVAVVAIGALVYLGSSVSNTVNAVATAVTPDPPTINPVSSVSLANLTSGNPNCNVIGSSLTTCSSYDWLIGYYYYASATGPWTLITAANDQHVFRRATHMPPVAWTCPDNNGTTCNTITTPSGPPLVQYALGALS
jgi:Flp pilus assembly pilin Flp